MRRISERIEQLTLGHSALTRAMRIFAEEMPEASVQATMALNLLLEGIYCSNWPEIAWSFSQLTGDKFPLEFSFSSADSAIRYVTEVSGPELAETQRLACVERHLERLGTHQLPRSVSTSLHKIQQSGPLFYGAWLSGRHSADKNSYKLYAEVPEGESAEADAFVRMLLGDMPILSGRRLELCMIGYESGTTRSELYFRADGLQPREVHMLLHRFNIMAREEELFRLIESAYGRSVRRVLPATRMGFSVSVPMRGEPVIFSLYTFARSIFGSDGNIRRGMLALGERQGWNLHSYEKLSEPVANRTSWSTRHGGIAFVVPPEGPLIVHIGLRPPEHESRV